MSRFPRPRFASDFGSYPAGGRPFLPPNQSAHGHPRPPYFPYPAPGPAQFTDGPQRLYRFQPAQFRPAAPLPNNPRFCRHPRPQFGPRVAPGPRSQGNSHWGGSEGARGIEAYYKHSMVENPWRHLEAKIKGSS